MSTDKKFVSKTRKIPTEASTLLSRVSMRRTAEGFRRYVNQLDEYLAIGAVEIPKEYDPSHVVGGTGVAAANSEPKPSYPEMTPSTAVPALKPVDKVVLYEPAMTAGNRLNVNFSVKEGNVTIDWVAYRRNSDGRFTLKSDTSFPLLVAGETYMIQMYLCPKSGYTFNVVNGKPVCDVRLSNGKQLTPMGTAQAQGGGTSYSFYINVSVPGTAAPVTPAPTTINRVVLNAPALSAGNKINYDYTVKDGNATVEWVTYVRSSDNKYFINRQEYPVLTAGEKYSVHVYLYPKSGYTFKESNGSAVCDVVLADGTKLVSSSWMTANGKRCCHFSYNIEIKGSAAPALTTINRVVLTPPSMNEGNKMSFDFAVKEGAATVEWVMYYRQSDNKRTNYKEAYPVLAAGERYAVHVYLYPKPGYTFKESNGSAVCDVVLADGTKLVSSSWMTANGKRCCHFSYNVSVVTPITADHVRYVTCLNRGGYVAALRVHYQKPGSTAWESVTSGTFAIGKSKTYDLVSELNLPVNTLVQAEVVVKLGKNNKSSRILKVHPQTSKTASFTCSGTTLSNKLALEIKP